MVQPEAARKTKTAAISLSRRHFFSNPNKTNLTMKLQLSVLAFLAGCLCAHAASLSSSFAFSEDGANFSCAVAKHGQEVFVATGVKVPAHGWAADEGARVDRIWCGTKISALRTEHGVSVIKAEETVQTGWRMVQGRRYPITSTRAARIETDSDTGRIVLPLSTTTIEKRFLFLRWTRTSIQPERVFTFRRTDA